MPRNTPSVFGGGLFCRTRIDDFVLELAVAAEARYIVTHNVRHFVGVEAFGVGIITPAQMLFKLNEIS